jgi:putative ABC transport system substrate-binding protein
MPGFLDEIRATRPTWSTPGAPRSRWAWWGRTTACKGQHITDIPVVFTLVAAPMQAKIVADLRSSGATSPASPTWCPPTRRSAPSAPTGRSRRWACCTRSTEKNSVVVLDEIRRLGRERGFHTVERSFRLDAQRKPTADGAADLVRELKDAGAQWLYLPPDSYLGTLAEGVIIPAAMEVGLPTFASTEQLMQAGALSGLVSRYYNVGQFTAHKAEQILVGRQAPSSDPGGNAEALLVPDPHGRGAPAEAAAAAADVQLRRADHGEAAGAAEPPGGLRRLTSSWPNAAPAARA